RLDGIWACRSAMCLGGRRSCDCPLFPYTTLFRSGDVAVFDSPRDGTLLIKRIVAVGGDRVTLQRGRLTVNGESHDALDQKRAVRSEEHTSELQSRENIVCRLLLEKKKKDACMRSA